MCVRKASLSDVLGEGKARDEDDENQEEKGDRSDELLAPVVVSLTTVTRISSQ